jgi:hypothetical protein
MDALFTLVRSRLLSNMTMQIKGWVGPTISQPGKWPAQMHTPTPGAERRQAMADRFNAELALFLLVAEDHMWWLYVLACCLRDLLFICLSLSLLSFLA